MIDKSLEKLVKEINVKTAYRSAWEHDIHHQFRAPGKIDHDA